jgi:hypothetical protein
MLSLVEIYIRASKMMSFYTKKHQERSRYKKIYYKSEEKARRLPSFIYHCSKLRFSYDKICSKQIIKYLMKILKKLIIFSDIFSRSLIGIGAVFLLFCIFKKNKKIKKKY